MIDLFLKVLFRVVWRLRFGQGLEKGHLNVPGIISKTLYPFVIMQEGSSTL